MEGRASPLTTGSKGRYLPFYGVKREGRRKGDIFLLLRAIWRFVQLLDLANPSLQQCTFGMLNSGEVRLPTPPPTDQIVNPGMLRSYRLILRTSGESSWAAAGKASTINAAPKIRTPSILHLELYTPQP